MLFTQALSDGHLGLYLDDISIFFHFCPDSKEVSLFIFLKYSAFKIAR